MDLQLMLTLWASPCLNMGSCKIFGTIFHVSYFLSWICQFRISGGNGRWAGREGTGEARVVRSCKYSKDILDTNRSPDAIVKCTRQVSPLCAPWSWNLERTSPWIGQVQISELEERADGRVMGAHGEGSKWKVFCENNNDQTGWFAQDLSKMIAVSLPLLLDTPDTTDSNIWIFGTKYYIGYVTNTIN